MSFLVQLFQDYRQAFGAGGLLFILFGVLFVVLGVVWIARERRFAARAMTAGVVVLALTERHTTIDDSPTTLLFPVVRFTGMTGEEITFENPTGSRPAVARVGQQVSVIYDPIYPHSARLASGCLRYGVSVAFIALGIGFVGFGAVFALIQWFVNRLP